jgi:hypothetical protein
MEFINHIVNSKIHVECKLNRWRPEDFSALYIRAFDLSRAAVNTIAFAMGYGLTVHLDAFVDPAEKMDCRHLHAPSCLAPSMDKRERKQMRVFLYSCETVWLGQWFAGSNRSPLPTMPELEK